MKLRTLNDLIKENDDELTFGGYTDDVLRDQAIKWIKAKDMKIWDFLVDDIEDGDVNDIYMLKIGLKKFFNITEEDLE